MKSKPFTLLLRTCSLIAIVWLSADLFLHDFIVKTVSKKLERFGVSDATFRVGVPGLRGLELRNLSFSYRTGNYKLQGQVESVSLAYDLLASTDELVSFVQIDNGVLVVNHLKPSVGISPEKEEISLLAVRPLIDELITSLPLKSGKITDLVVSDQSGSHVVKLNLEFKRSEGFVLQAATTFGAYSAKAELAYTIHPPLATVSTLVTERESARAKALLEATFTEKTVRLSTTSHLMIAPALLGFPDQELAKISIGTPWTFTLNDDQVSIGPARARVDRLTLTTPALVTAAGAINLQLQKGVISRKGTLADLRGSIKAMDVSVVLPAEPPRTFHLESVAASYDDKSRRGKEESFGVPIAIIGLNIEELLALYPQEEILGTGVADSEFELTVRQGDSLQRAGIFSVTNGTVVARAPGGRLSYKSKALADTAQSALASGLSALEDFRYDGLSGEFDFAESGSLALRLKLEGSNPGWQNGRAVKLNLNVEENLYELLRSLRLTTEVTTEVSRAIQSPKAR